MPFDQRSKDRIDRLAIIQAPDALRSPTSRAHLNNVSPTEQLDARPDDWAATEARQDCRLSRSVRVGYVSGCLHRVPPG